MKQTALIVAVAIACCDCKSKAEKPSPAAVTSSLVEDLSPVDSASALPVPSKAEPWSPAYCAPAAEGEAPSPGSDLSVSGTCAFTQHALATCRARDDDYYAIVRRPLADGHELEIYFNVEYYSTPGPYERKVEVIALLRRGLSLYRWSNMTATARLSLEGKERDTPNVVELERTELGAEPGTPTTGSIVLSGTIRCLVKPLPH